MIDVSAREATPDEWAARLVGKDQTEIAIAIAAAEARGRRKGQDDYRGAADHFETAYRYATNAHRPGADSADLLDSARMFADMGYSDMQKTTKD